MSDHFSLTSRALFLPLNRGTEESERSNSTEHLFRFIIFTVISSGDKITLVFDPDLNLRHSVKFTVTFTSVPALTAHHILFSSLITDINKEVCQ